MIAPIGRTGLVLPSGIATDSFNRFFFDKIMRSRSIESLFSFDNKEALFPAVKSSFRFCLLTLTGSAATPKQDPQFVFYAQHVEDVLDRNRRFSLSVADIELLNPNSGTCAVFRSSKDAELAKEIYRRVPILVHPTEAYFP